MVIVLGPSERTLCRQEKKAGQKFHDWIGVQIPIIEALPAFKTENDQFRIPIPIIRNICSKVPITRFPPFPSIPLNVNLQIFFLPTLKHGEFFS